jgi:predicted HicB family RNase H-like nuclease
MTVSLPPEVEIVIAERARAEGISAEEYVERLVRDATQQAPQRAAALPSWAGRTLSDLDREQLYEDVL